MPDEQNQRQIEAMQALVRLAEKRTELSAKRNELSAQRTMMAAQRTYMNTERTLSVWVRTALAAMIFGIAVDRFGLMFGHSVQSTSGFILHSNIPSTITGAILVAFSIIMVFTAALRFIRFTNTYKKKYPFPAHHHATLPIIYSFMVVVFGTALLFLMFWID